MSIQAISAVIESCLYSGGQYAVLLSLANHADPDGYAFPGKGLIADEARMTERHVKRVLKSLMVDVDTATPEALQAAPVWRLGERTSKLGTNDYQLNLDLFRDAARQMDLLRREKRAGRPPKKGGTFAPQSPPENGGTFGPGGTSESMNGDSKSHPVGDTRSPPNHQPEGNQGARARQAPDPDWKRVRDELKAILPQEQFAADIARLSADGVVVKAGYGLGGREVADRYGTYLKNHGFERIRTEHEEIAL